MSDAKPILGEDTIFGRIYYSATDYAAIEAENAALKHRCGMLGLELENAEERRLQAERQVAILRQHKTDYMEAAEGTRRALEAECERLRVQVSALQSDANSWQSGYDKGRADGYGSGRKERDALTAENEALVRNLRGKHSLVGATYEHLIRQRDEALAKLAELEAIKEREPVLWFRSLIGAQCKPDGRCYDVVFSPCEGFMPLYALPSALHDQDQPK